MENNTWIDIAPWIAIAVTLIISIIIPMLTQLINNRFALNQQKITHVEKLYDAKMQIINAFFQNVGACIAHADTDRVHNAGANILSMYCYIPKENWSLLDELYSCIRKRDMDQAEAKMIELSKLMSNLIAED